MPTAPTHLKDTEYNSDDEAPSGAVEEQHSPDKDKNAMQKQHKKPRGNGYIYTDLKAAQDKIAPKYHVAVDWNSIPKHVKDCKAKERRTCVKVQC